MKNYLRQSNAAFYHLSPLENLESIQKNGLKAVSGKIFVSIEAPEYLLASIAAEQIPEIYDASGYVVVKLSQDKNHFLESELYHDNQAPIETARHFQFIIVRNKIQPENLEIFDTVKFGNEGSNMLSRLSKDAWNLKESDELVQKAAAIIANKFPEPPIDDYWK